MFGAGGIPALEYDLLVSKWFKIILLLVTLFFPPISHQLLSHTKPNPPLVSIIVTGNCDPTQGCDPAPAHLLVYCNLTVSAPFLWSLSHSFLVANAAATSTELYLALTTFPMSGAPASARFLLCWTNPESTLLLSWLHPWSRVTSFQIKLEGHCCLSKWQMFQPTLEPNYLLAW